MFSLFFIAIGLICFRIWYVESKPCYMFLNPTSASSNVLNKLLKIEAMPESAEKHFAYQQWHQECKELYQQIKQQEQN